MNIGIPEKLKYFFKNEEHDFFDDKIFITRTDGHLLYSTEDNLDSCSAGALISGVWQAANALGQFIPSVSKGDFFRLSFDTSSKGLYIFPFLIQKEEYYFGIAYGEKLNPGQLKMQVKRIASKLEHFLKDVDIYSASSKRDGYLFENISDTEMDRLFSAVSV